MMAHSTSSSSYAHHGLFKLSFKALGSPCVIQFRAEEVTVAKLFRERVMKWLKWFEARYSRFLHDSVISEINRKAGTGQWTELSDSDEKVFTLANDIFFQTQGLLDVTAMPLTSLWDTAEKGQTIPSSGVVYKALSLVGWRSVEREMGRVRLPRAGMCIDLGGFGKEYAVDQCVGIARGCGIEHALVDLGRDVFAYGTAPELPFWLIGMEGAKVPDSVISRLGITGQGVASSGNYRRLRRIQNKEYGHIIHPKTGYPFYSSVLGVTCIGGTCLSAGIYSTSAYLMELEQGLDYLDSAVGVEGYLQTAEKGYSTRRFAQYEIKRA